MDYMSEFDIQLSKEMYYAGETLTGFVLLKTLENFKLKAIKVNLRGKAHSEWKMMINGEKRTVKDDQVFIDERSLIFGSEASDVRIPILQRGHHVFEFQFKLPESELPCSFEARECTIRYYVRVILDIPYASAPQGIKYFTLVGPHIDCMDQRYLKPQYATERQRSCCFCCARSLLQLKCQLERTAYCAGEAIRLKADIVNQSEQCVRLKAKLTQTCEYFIDRGVLGLSKQNSHTVLEYRGEEIPSRSRSKFDSAHSLVVPVMPPTLSNVCKLVQINYALKVWLETDKPGDCLHITLPIVIGTCPFRIPNSNQKPKIDYEVCCDHVEGGMYIGPEFQLGQVYDGSQAIQEEVVLYRPVYVSVKNRHRSSSAGSHHHLHHHHHKNSTHLSKQISQESHEEETGIEGSSKMTAMTSMHSPSKLIIQADGKACTIIGGSVTPYIRSRSHSQETPITNQPKRLSESILPNVDIEDQSKSPLLDSSVENTAQPLSNKRIEEEEDINLNQKTESPSQK